MQTIGLGSEWEGAYRNGSALENVGDIFVNLSKLTSIRF